MRSRSSKLGATLTLIACLVFSHRVQAATQRLPEPDGVYGRFDGDLDLSLSAGAHWDLKSGAARLALGAQSHLYWTLGLYATYEESLSASRGLARVGSLGLHLRPLFLLRFSEDMEQGPALLDLTLDSVGLGLGGFLAEPRAGAFADESGGEIWLGMGVPLTGAASGAWLLTQAGARTGSSEDWFIRAALSFDLFFLSPVTARLQTYQDP